MSSEKKLMAGETQKSSDFLSHSKERGETKKSHRPLSKFGLGDEPFPYSMKKPQKLLNPKEYLEVFNMGMEKKKEEKKKSGKQPDFRICSGIKKDDGSTYWHQIGSAWDGEKGISIVLNSLPLTEKLMMFRNQEQEDS